ncbi:MAG: hypothetical protein LBC87_01075 [Fibromonadaceae bacterium]|jgi:hypothetical protein|nr:hypothetical protein [Fibromonadaceae bacterium]
MSLYLATENKFKEPLGEALWLTVEAPLQAYMHRKFAIETNNKLTPPPPPPHLRPYIARIYKDTNLFLAIYLLALPLAFSQKFIGG